MTTDNRTSEPSEEQVEAALDAHAAHKGAWVDEFKEMVCPECGWCYMTSHERKPDSKPSNEVVYARVDAHRMRAALVAATRVPVQGEPNDDREEVLRKALEHVREVGESGLAGPYVHDLPKDVDSNLGWLQTMWPVVVAVDIALASRTTMPDAATAAIERARVEVESINQAAQKSLCGSEPDHAGIYEGAARALAALDGAPEPEWEYIGRAFEHGGFMRIRNDQLVPEKFESWRKLMAKYPRVEILKRVKAVPAGLWLPVEGESDD